MLSALGRRRREQLWHRAFGRRVAVPVRPAPAAAAEVALRLGADEPSARMLDTGLRHLAQALAAPGPGAADGLRRARRPPPAGSVGGARADREAPAPWVAVDDGQVWRLPLAVVPGLDPDQVAGARAPYPGLVSIGTDATGRVLIDLEAAQGLIAVTGEPHLVQAALAAMAVELVTNRWSGPVSITLVGFGADLAALAPGQVSAVWLARRGAAGAGGPRRAGGRIPAAPGAAEVHYVISAVPPSAAEREQLLALARAGPRRGLGVCDRGRHRAVRRGRGRSPSRGGCGPGRWGWTCRRSCCRPSRAPRWWTCSGWPSSSRVALSAPLPDAAPAGHLIPGSAAQVDVTLLGRTRVNAPG
mgnify:CR=1 FL=1